MPVIRRLVNGQWLGYNESSTGGGGGGGGSPTFSSAVNGGGFQNAIAVSPFYDTDGNRPYLIGADVAGVHRSVTQGKQWFPTNNGSLSNNNRIAAILWSDVTPGKVWVAEDNGLHVSTDFGVNWTQKSNGSQVDWDANNALTTGMGEHPRQTGFLIQQDNSTSTKYLWVGTNTKGVRQSIDGGSTWRTSVLAGNSIHSIALDPNNRDVLYAAVSRSGAANGVYKITNARSASMTATKLSAYPGGTSNPVGPEELLAVSYSGTTKIYVAGHSSGMFKYDPVANTWSTINSGLPLSGEVYRSIGVHPTDKNTLYCGCWHPNNKKAIFRSTDAGNSWSAISGPWVVAPATGQFVLDWNEFGTNTKSWLKDIGYHSFANSNDWLASMIATDPDVPNRVLLSGRGGAWWGTDDGSGNWTWQPAAHGLMVTVMMAVVVDDYVDGRALLGNMDYTSLVTTDGGASVQSAKPNGAPSTGDCVTIDMATTSGGGTFFVGASVRGGPSGVGGVYSSDNADLGPDSTWTDETGSAFNADVMALAVGRNSSGQRVILAATSQQAGTTQGGLWRKVGGSWTQFRTANNPFGLTTTASTNNYGCLRFRRNSPVCYAIDNGALWRSDDAGLTWIKLVTGVGVGGLLYNQMKMDPSDTSTIYYTNSGVLKRVNNAQTSTGTGSTSQTTLWSSGGTAANIATYVDGSAMFINLRDGRIMKSTDFRTANSQAACNWTDISDAFVRAMTGNIRSMSITKDGYLLTCEEGSGTVRGLV